MKMNELDYLKPIEIAEGIYWIGYSNEGANLHCNPYIIIDGEEAVLLDGGSRDDFSIVMLKILRLGVNPKNIKALIYHHNDPDLCSSIPQFEAMIDSDDLGIISDKTEHLFIRYYSSSELTKSKRVCIDEIGYEYKFSSGRILKFISTPYVHNPGSFMTFDPKTNTLFTSDIFGSYEKEWNLYRHLLKECEDCISEEICKFTNKDCFLKGILKFHQSVMPSRKALRYSLELIKSLEVDLIAPQHGSLINSKFDRDIIIRNLESLEDVGFDYYLSRRNK